MITAVDAHPRSRDVVLALGGIVIGVLATLICVHLFSGPQLPSEETIVGSVQGYSGDGHSMVVAVDGDDTTSFHLSDEEAAAAPPIGSKVKLRLVHLDGHQDIVVSVKKS